VEGLDLERSMKTVTSAIRGERKVIVKLCTFWIVGHLLFFLCLGPIRPSYHAGGGIMSSCIQLPPSCTCATIVGKIEYRQSSRETRELFMHSLYSKKS